MLWGAEPNQFVRARLAAAEPGTAVDVACGNGRNAVWLARRGWRVTGIDISGVAVEQAQRRAAECGVEVGFEVGDVRTWAPVEPVDLMLVAYLHLPMPDLIAVLRAAAHRLTATGRLLYVGHSRTNLTRGYGGPSDPEVLAEIADLAAAAEGFAVVELGHLFRATDAGDAIDIVLDVRPWPAEPAGVSGDPHPGQTRAGGR
jgi:SAM-dependent methyltransferase